MKLVLLGLASLMCTSMVLNANMLPADKAAHDRRHAELREHKRQRDELNAKIGRLEEHHAQETSRAHVRHAESQERSLAQDQKAGVTAAA